MAGCSFMDMAHQPTFDIREDPCQPRVLLVTALSAVLPWPAAMTYLPAGPSCPLAWGHRHIARRTPWSCRPHPQPHGSPHGSRTDTCSCRGGDGARGPTARPSRQPAAQSPLAAIHPGGAAEPMGHHLPNCREGPQCRSPAGQPLARHGQQALPRSCVTRQASKGRGALV